MASPPRELWTTRVPLHFVFPLRALVGVRRVLDHGSPVRGRASLSSVWDGLLADLSREATVRISGYVERDQSDNHDSQAELREGEVESGTRHADGQGVVLPRPGHAGVAGGTPALAGTAAAHDDRFVGSACSERYIRAFSAYVLEFSNNFVFAEHQHRRHRPSLRTPYPDPSAVADVGALL